MTDQAHLDQPEQDSLLTITEVAELLRVPVGTLRYWRHLDIGPASFKIGRGVRYLRSEVTRWFHDQASATTTMRIG